MKKCNNYYKKNIYNIGLMTSGGDSPGMNAAIRAIVRASFYYGLNCLGIRLGYKGLIEGKFMKLEPKKVKNILHKGGTILKTARSNEFKTVEGMEKAYNNFIKKKLQGLIIIGGNGTFKGALYFSKKYNLPIIGIPGTIDNDLSGTDYTIGYDTALNTAIEAIDKIKDTATSHNRIFFIEVMGKNSGFIALNSGIATGALTIIFSNKKNKKNINEIFFSLEKGKKRGKTSSIIIVSEGKKLGGVYDLAKITKIKYPNYDIRVSILGHIQRGGNPTCTDRVLASRLGVASVEAIMSGKKNLMVGLESNKIVFTNFKDAIQKKNKIDKNLIKISDIISYDYF